MTEEVVSAPQAAPEGETAQQPVSKNAVIPGEQQTPILGDKPAPEPQQTDPTPGAQPDDKTPAEAKKQSPWFERRIAELTAKNGNIQRENEALRALVAATNGGAPAQPQSQQPSAPQQQFVSVQDAINDPRVKAAAIEQAKQEMAARTLTEAANKTYETGKAAYGAEFDAAVRTLATVTDLTARVDFMEAVTSLPNSADVYYYLGTHPDEAGHLFGKSPVGMALDLAQISAKVGKPKPQSKAPAPVTPIGKGAAPASELDESLPTAEWIRLREEQLAKRRGET